MAALVSHARSHCSKLVRVLSQCGPASSIPLFVATSGERGSEPLRILSVSRQLLARERLLLLLICTGGTGVEAALVALGEEPESAVRIFTPRCYAVRVTHVLHIFMH
jgi:hypothetical protein